MHLIKNITVGFLFLFFLSLVFVKSPIHADGEFDTDYKVVYQVAENGKTTVTEDINLKNKTANYYADKFELKIGSTKVSEVSAKDSVGPMEINVQFENNITTISVKFNERVIGLGKSLPWTLSYTSSELATKSGQIWEVSIPRLAKSSEIASYEARIIVPASFGPVAFAVPWPQTTEKQGLNQVFSFSKDQLTKSGISMSFGSKQVFEFTLTYFLENNNLTAQTGELPLPPDNNYQKVVIESIDPAPTDVVVDGDGNFIAKYRMPPKRQINVIARGYVEIFSKPFRNLESQMTIEEKNRYLQPQRYWETDSAGVKDKAKELKTAQEIYNFVTNYLVYKEDKLNLKEIDRLGAAQALNSPKEAVCMEFTDLFIALARAAGIPAREVVGYAYTQNTRLRPLSFSTQGDLLHAWPEFWDDTLGWIQVDPTWGSTSGGLDYFNKMDFNHVTLVQRGLSSTEPFPPGSYKKRQNAQEKDVSVSFAENLPQLTTTPQLSMSVSDKIISGIPVRVNTQIKNIGSTSILGGSLTLESSHLETTSPNPLKLGLLPPYSTRYLVFNMQSKSFLSKYNDTIVATFKEAQISQPVVIIPFYYLLISPTFFISLALATVIIITGLTLYHRFSRRKFKFPPHLL